MHRRVARIMFAASTFLGEWGVGAPIVQCQPPARMSETTRGALAGILSQFPPILAAAADDSLPAAWQIEMPRDTNRVDWVVIRRAVLRLLRARPRRGTDQRWSDLTIGNVRVSLDSVAFTFRIGGGQRCGDGVVGSSATYAVEFARFAVPWTPRGTPIQFSDGIGCDLPASPAESPRPVVLPPVPILLRFIRPSPVVVVPKPASRARKP